MCWGEDERRGERTGGQRRGRTRREAEEDEHLSQGVDDEGEQENKDAVEENFGQTNQQASSLQIRLQNETHGVDFKPNWPDNKAFSFYADFKLLSLHVSCLLENMAFIINPPSVNCYWQQSELQVSPGGMILPSPGQRGWGVLTSWLLNNARIPLKQQVGGYKTLL